MSPTDTAQGSWFSGVAAGTTELWAGLEPAWRLVLLGAGGIVLLLLLVWGLRVVGAKGRRYLLRAMTFVGLLGALGLGWWTQHLPEVHGTYFVLWHQLVRVGAALSATLCVLGAMAIALPHVLNVLERRGLIAHVAARYVRSGRSGFLTVMSVLSISGVAVSAFALCAVLSILGGFGEDLKVKILGNSPQLLVDTENPSGFGDWQAVLEEVRGVQGVVAATPVAGGKAITSSTLSTAGVVVHGIDLKSASSVIDLEKNLEVGSLDYLDDPETLADLPAGTPIGIGPSGEMWLKSSFAPRQFDPSLDPDVQDVVRRPVDVLPGIIIGRELGRTLSVQVSDTITLVAPLGDLGPMGIMPRRREFRVAGIFYSGMYEFDAAFVYTKLAAAEAFFDLGDRVTGIYVRVANPDDVNSVTTRVGETLAATGLRVRNWQGLNSNLFSALKLEKLATFVTLGITVMVASFCIICTLLLMVAEKSKDIAIIKALGAPDHTVLRIFMAEGAIIGGIGTVFGVVLGLVACLGLKWFGVRVDPEVYYVDHLPVTVNLVDYAVVAGSAIVISTLMTIFPAWSASRVRPVDGLRYE